MLHRYELRYSSSNQQKEKYFMRGISPTDHLDLNILKLMETNSAKH